MLMWEEHRLRVFENSMLRIYGPQRDDITGGGGCRKLYNEELNDLYASPNIAQ